MKKIRVCRSAVFTALGLLLLFPLRQLLPITAAILLHEGCHLAVAWCGHAVIESVSVVPFGILIRTSDLEESFRLPLALAGGVGNLIGWFFFRSVFPTFSEACFSFGILNLLPIQGLDGADALNCLLRHFGNERISRRISFGVSCFFLTAVWLISGYFLLNGIGGLSLYFLCLLLFYKSCAARRG